MSDYNSPNIGTLKFIPAGIFYGKDTNYNYNWKISAFHMSRYDITRAQFSNVMGTDPSDPSIATGTDDPVQQVNWYQALVFCNKLSVKEGLTPVYSIKGSSDPSTWGEIPMAAPDKTWDAVVANWSASGYRLPTVCEWCWAAMGADKANPGKFNNTGFFKAFPGSTGTNTNNIENYVWFTDNSDFKTHPVGAKLPNELGLFDMSGNVWQWCWDWGVNTAESLSGLTNLNEMPPSGSYTDWRGPGAATYRTKVGGCYDEDASLCAISQMWGDAPNSADCHLGFRVVRP